MNFVCLSEQRNITTPPPSNQFIAMPRAKKKSLKGQLRKKTRVLCWSISLLFKGARIKLKLNFLIDLL